MTPPSGCVPSSPPWRLSVSRWQRPTLAGSAEPRPLAPRGVGSGRSWRGWLTEQGLFDQVSPKREDHTTGHRQAAVGCTAALPRRHGGEGPAWQCHARRSAGDRGLPAEHRVRGRTGYWSACSARSSSDSGRTWFPPPPVGVDPALDPTDRPVRRDAASGWAPPGHRGTGGYHRARGYHRAGSGELATLDATAADRPKGHAAIAGRCLRPRVFEHARSTCGDGSDGSDGATMIEATQQRHVPHVLDGWR